MFLKTPLNRVRDTRGRLKDYRLDWDLKMREVEELQNNGRYEEFIEQWKGEEVRGCRWKMEHRLHGETGPVLTSVRALNSLILFSPSFQPNVGVQV
jgi:hypothetical protein